MQSNDLTQSNKITERFYVRQDIRVYYFDKEMPENQGFERIVMNDVNDNENNEVCQI